MVNLHDLVEAAAGNNWDEFLTQFEAAADEDVLAVDDMESSLLDKCIKLHAPIHVVEAICKRSPSLAERVHPLIGTLPLHEACHPVSKNHTFLKIRENSMYHLFITCLLNVYPQGATVPDQENMLPLHVLVQHRPPLALVKELVSKMDDEKLFLTKDLEHQTPLHVAIEHYADETIVLFLIQKCEKAVKIPGKEGYLPLHTAVLQQTTMPVLKRLLEVDKGALLNSGNNQKMQSMAVAFHPDLAPHWQLGYQNPKSTFPDGTSADGCIEAPPSGLLSVKEIVDVLLMNIPHRLNVFTKTMDVTKVNDKTWTLFRRAMQPIIRAAKECRKKCTPCSTPDLDAIIKKIGMTGEEP